MATKRLLEDDDLFTRACRAWTRDGGEQPSRALSEVADNVVVLRNVRGELARYEAKRVGIGGLKVRVVRIESDESFLYETQVASNGQVSLVPIPAAALG